MKRWGSNTAELYMYKEIITVFSCVSTHTLTHTRPDHYVERHSGFFVVKKVPLQHFVGFFLS